MAGEEVLKRLAGRVLAYNASRLVSLGLKRSPLIYRLGNYLIDVGLSWRYPQRERRRRLEEVWR